MRQESSLGQWIFSPEESPPLLYYYYHLVPPASDRNWIKEQSSSSSNKDLDDNNNQIGIPENRIEQVLSIIIGTDRQHSITFWIIFFYCSVVSSLSSTRRRCTEWEFPVCYCTSRTRMVFVDPHGMEKCCSWIMTICTGPLQRVVDGWLVVLHAGRRYAHTHCHTHSVSVDSGYKVGKRHRRKVDPVYWMECQSYIETYFVAESIHDIIGHHHTHSHPRPWHLLLQFLSYHHHQLLSLLMVAA